MTDLEILKGMRELLAEPEHWTQGWFARDKYGMQCQPASKEAVCFCLTGASIRVSGEFKPPLSLRILLPEHMFDFNDRHSHAEVIAKLDEAIALEESHA